ncbi:cytochrome c [Beijerinckia sp. L45]|uniref:c-type cytochrome n=1 Tax=Beijerinckia sp. L45 TaxID=1641855 RepID=UPI00131AB2A4|nr:cytochrome c [Beijerinckia sp. L45]
MRKLFGGLSIVLLIGATTIAGALYATQPTMPHGAMAQMHVSEQSFSQVERGRYLTTVGDCAACHTDTQGGAPFGGGRAIETPFGLVLAPNITPDRETGIGGWSDAEFANALQHGVSKDGHMLYPAMPYVYYTKAHRSDINAIRAYLSTVTPVHNKVVANQLPFPFNIRLAMRAWNALYFRAGGFQQDTAQNADWNRGAYLVQSLEHCGACHTPKSVLGGDKTSEAFQGYAIQGWFAPNITGDMRRGIGTWSVDDIVVYLQTGHNKQAAASGPMAEEVDQSSSRMPVDDLRAMAVYLKSIPGQDDSVKPLDASDPMMQAGRAIYDDSCAACHKTNGAGIAGLFPTLRAAPAVQSREATSLMRVVLDGAKSAATDKAPTGAAMPSYAWQLDDAQVAAVLTYIRNAWGNQAPAVSASEVASMRANLMTQPN